MIQINSFYEGCELRTFYIDILYVCEIYKILRRFLKWKEIMKYWFCKEIEYYNLLIKIRIEIYLFWFDIFYWMLNYKNEWIWSILPVVICLSQRLSHACVSINNLYLWNCEWLNKSVIIYLIVALLDG